MMKSQSGIYTNINGHAESHVDTKSEVKQDGRLVAGVVEHVDKEQPSADAPASGSLRIDVDVPEKNIHKSTVQRLLPDIRPHQEQQQLNVKRGGSTSSEQEEDVLATDKIGGIQYTPLDMAQYVFWTGDEKGVTSSIEEFLQAGIMTREEAISYLQEIKYNLEYLQIHYNNQFWFNGNSDRSKTNAEYIAQELSKARGSIKQLQELQQLDTSQDVSKPSLKTNYDLTKFRLQAMKKSTPAFDTTESDMQKSDNSDSVDNDELMERLRVADFLYTEYSLEEIIYQLAKVMFTQGLTRGSAEAQQALQKFTKFLETEAEQGHISRTLEKKVLDVLIASLTDTLSEHPEIQTIREYSQEENRQKALRQIMQMIPQEKDPHASRVDIQLKDNSRDPFVDLAKYKTIR
ncbi:uncharacterized protein [Atheta coriaria]|uniref:uncharacterized protein n=1 Tax=Dalotia coriaria TaxID=877792 RepID=UPI0031F37734